MRGREGVGRKCSKDEGKALWATVSFIGVAAAVARASHFVCCASTMCRLRQDATGDGVWGASTPDSGCCGDRVAAADHRSRGEGMQRGPGQRQGVVQRPALRA